MARLAQALASVRARRSLDEMDGWLPASGGAYLRSGRVDVSPILTHRVPLSDFQRAADLAGSAEVGKVVLYPPEGGW